MLLPSLYPLPLQSATFLVLHSRLVLFSPLRNLNLDNIGLSAECCGGVLQKVLSLGSKGLRTLNLSAVGLMYHAKPLVQTISNDNFYIQSFKIFVHLSLEWEDADEGLESSCRDTLNLALKRNKGLENETRQATPEILQAARVLLLGYPDPLLILNGSFTRRHFLDLPRQLLQPIFSCVYPGALSEGQLRSILRYATDRDGILGRRARLVGPLRRRLHE